MKINRQKIKIIYSDIKKNIKTFLVFRIQTIEKKIRSLKTNFKNFDKSKSELNTIKTYLNDFSKKNLYKFSRNGISKIKSTKINFSIKDFKLKKFKLREINSNTFIFYLYFLLGVLISLIIFSLVTLRIIATNNKLNQSINVALEKKSQLTNLAINLKEIKNLQRKIIKHNDFLERLIGGKNNLQTLLYMINILAKNNSIEVIEFEPIKKINFADTSSSNPNNINPSVNVNSSLPPPPPNQIKTIKDSNTNYLLTNKLQRHIIKVKLRGYFTDLLKFVKDFESLENLVIIDDFKLKRLEDYKKSSRSKIEFESELSIFGKLPSNDKKIIE